MMLIGSRRPEACYGLSTALGARTPARSRRGIAALIALVCLSLATIVGTLLLQAALGEQTYLSRLERKSQGDWLVEAGFSRARAQLAKSARYSGESWAIPGSSLGRTQDAVVRIVARSDSANSPRRHVDVTATFAQTNEPAIEASRDFPTR
jgi:type II secretory pathway component PulK